MQRGKSRLKAANEEMPKVSICIPAYRNPAGIARLLASVKGQTYTDYEVVVTDDSPDESVRDAALLAGVKNLRYYKNETRLGASGNWNEAVRRSCGDLIKMMHHDDWFAAPDSLERLVGLLEENPSAALAFCGTWQVSLAEEAAGQDPFESAGQKPSADRFSRCISQEHLDLLKKDWRNLFLGNYIGAPSAVLYRKNRLEYAKELTWLVDVEYYMRLLRENFHFSCTTEPLVCIGVSAGQLTRKCEQDGDLNLREYGYLFREFGLQGTLAYETKLAEVALAYHKTWKDVRPYGAVKEIYCRTMWKKRAKDLRFLAGVAKKKVFG